MKNVKIYILEDDRFYAEFVRTHLISEGFEPVVFHSEASCVEALKKSQPDILIMDHKLEHTTGLELMESLDKYLRRTAVIYISAQDHYHVTLKALRIGVVDYIEKGEGAIPQLKKVMAKIRKHSFNFEHPVNLKEYRLDTNFRA